MRRLASRWRMCLVDCRPVSFQNPIPRTQGTMNRLTIGLLLAGFGRRRVPTQQATGDRFQWRERSRPRHVLSRDKHFQRVGTFANYRTIGPTRRRDRLPRSARQPRTATPSSTRIVSEARSDSLISRTRPPEARWDGGPRPDPNDDIQGLQPHVGGRAAETTYALVAAPTQVSRRQI